MKNLKKTMREMNRHTTVCRTTGVCRHMAMRLYRNIFAFAFAFFFAITAQSQTTVTQGLKIPRLDPATQRSQIPVSGNEYAKGQIIFNTENNCMEYWNGARWVSLCTGTANIELTGDPCNYNPVALAAADGSEPECSFTPNDNPPCTGLSGQPYQVYLTAGASYTTLTVDDVTSAFSVSFAPNNSASLRIAVVRVVNNCTGEYGDFLFTQDGAECDPAIPDPVLSSNTATLCVNGSVYASISNAQAEVEYLWEYGGVIVHTGNYYEIKRAGVYKVHAGYQGCGNTADGTISVTGNETLAPPPVTAWVTNSGMICGLAGVTLQAFPSPTGGNVIEWYQNGVKHGSAGTPLTVSGSAAEGEWFAVQSNGVCSSTKSIPSLHLVYNSTPSSLPAPQVEVNGTPLDQPITICKSGTLELKVINHTSYPPGTVYEWYDNAAIIAQTTDPFYYTVAPDKEEMVVSVKVSNNSSGCPVSATSSSMNVSQLAPAPTIINGGASNAFICGSNPAVLLANDATGFEYEWLHNGQAIPLAVSSSYSTSTPGSYMVRYRNVAGCWSMLSAPVNVLNNAAVTLSWIGGTPAASEPFASSKTYGVSAMPAAAGFNWQSSNPAVASISNPINNGQYVSVNFHTVGTAIISVSATDNGCGSETLTHTVDVVSGCAPITSLTLTPAVPVSKNLTAGGVYKSSADGSQQFTVTVNGGSSDNLSYQWYVGSTPVGANSNTYTFTTPTGTPSGQTDTIVRVVVKNGCSPTSADAGIQAQTTVRIIKDAPPPLTEGVYRFAGKTCFDLVQGNNGTGDCMPLSSRASNLDLAAPAPTHTYTFSATQSYSELTFIVDDPNDLLENHTSVIAPGPTTNSSILSIVFDKAALLAKVAGKNRTEALHITLTALFKDNGGVLRQLSPSLVLKVQDCSCGCMVGSNLRGPGGFLTFMCYNLGADPAVLSLTPTQQKDHATPVDNYGDLYQWGRMADGHQLRSSPKASGTVAVVTTAGDPRYGQPVTPTNVFRYRGANGGNWQASDIRSWSQGSRSPQDPCPVGWRVPTRAEWLSIVNGYSHTANISTGGNWTSTVTGNRWQWVASPTPGYLVTHTATSSTPTLFLPASGSRSFNNGNVSSGSGALYHSTTVQNATINYNLRFATTTLQHGDSSNRSNGMAVRCILDE